ncbi:MAG: ferric uptake regulation protein [Candidatus Magasanikbacteria bacterium GW2011_GWA2_37_8]|uniref:Ferric uptake regulation protein n=1 Tax=Candidatus Magasanikbacteria bacterium GW2011_GWA2_37_8 TaxID=1619036 RepID=A0A0G0JRZ6_9BACT|nr:MAG: ferric uptake regulation protein [Candidatus Magasanikbacteria bacterium GW2011_GWA2_37_8]
MEKLKKQLVKAGYKMTAPRIAVLEELSVSRHPISVRNLHKKIKAVNRASVYRTLNLLEESHLVNVEVIGKEKLYCLANVPHHHIICKQCGYMEEIKCNHNFGYFKNFSNIHHQLTLTGVCNKCAK